MIEFIGTVGCGFLFGVSTTFAFMAWEERRAESAKSEIDASAAALHTKMKIVMGNEKERKNGS